MCFGGALSCEDFSQPIETPMLEDLVENLAEAGLRWVSLS